MADISNVAAHLDPLRSANHLLAPRYAHEHLREPLLRAVGEDVGRGARHAVDEPLELRVLNGTRIVAVMLHECEHRVRLLDRQEEQTHARHSKLSGRRQFSKS